jgi:hypothetical protein
MQQAPFSKLPPLGEVTAPWWDDMPLAIVGTGISLVGFDFSRFQIPGVRVLAVKEAVWDLPFAECVFSLDRPWINRQAEKLNATSIPKVFAVEPEVRPCATITNSLYLLRSRFGGFSEDPKIIQSGANSGFGAVNYAYLKRAGRGGHPIVLFGFDYRPGPHYCQDRYHWQTEAHNQRYWEQWGGNFNDCRAQLDANRILVINASLESTVKAFPKVSVEDGLRCLENGRSL